MGEHPVIVVGVISGIVVIDSVKEHGEQAIGSKPVSSTFPRPLPSAPASRFLPISGPDLTSFKDEGLHGSLSQMNPFLPNLIFVFVFHQ